MKLLIGIDWSQDHHHVCFLAASGSQQASIESVKQSVWAATYWQEAYARCHSKSQAYRCLANRWLAIIWKMWQTRKPYDEAYHLKQRLLRRQPRLKKH